MRKTICLVAALAAMLTALSVNATAKPAKVWTDPAGDAGNAAQGLALPPAQAAGFDLVDGSIERKGGNLLFTVKHSAAMPQTGAFPEGFRFMWHFLVDKTEWRFTVKSADIGKPDVVAQKGTERIGQVYLEGVFRLETCAEEAGVALTLVNCGVVEYLDGKFDPASATFTVIAPLKVLKAKPGSVVTGGGHWAGSTQCMVCWVPHYAERSLTPTTVIDSAAQTVAYKVPK